MQPLWMFDIFDTIFSNNISNNTMIGGSIKKHIKNIIKKYTKYKLIKYY
jgi:hypothetical protein